MTFIIEQVFCPPKYKCVIEAFFFFPSGMLLLLPYAGNHVEKLNIDWIDLI